VAVILFFLNFIYFLGFFFGFKEKSVMCMNLLKNLFKYILKHMNNQQLFTLGFVRILE